MDKYEYIKVMHDKDRVVLFTDDNNIIQGLITYFLTNNFNKFRRQDIWSIPEEDIDGRFIYIDKAISNRNSEIKPNLFNLVKFFKQKYPNKKVVWISRRRKNELYPKYS